MQKGLTINDAGYDNSDENDAEGNPASGQRVDTHSSDKKKLIRPATEIFN